MFGHIPVEATSLRAWWISLEFRDPITSCERSGCCPRSYVEPLERLYSEREDMIWDLIQQFQISQVRMDAQAAKSDAAALQMESRHLKDRVQKLEETVERLSLAAMAMAEILCVRASVTQTEIEAKIQEIDLRDGKLDGKLREPANECVACHHVNAPTRRKCLYCGEPLPAGSGLFSSPSTEGTDKE